MDSKIIAKLRQLLGLSKKYTDEKVEETKRYVDEKFAAVSAPEPIVIPVEEIAAQVVAVLPKPKKLKAKKKNLTVNTVSPEDVMAMISSCLKDINTEYQKTGDTIVINEAPQRVVEYIREVVTEKGADIDYNLIFIELEKQVERMRQYYPVGTANSIRALMDVDLTGVPQNSKGVYLLAPGGGSGTPASAVTSETTFGQAPAVGTSTEYARADHTHGTPPDPIPAHLAALDPHPQYALDAQLATLQEGIQFRDEGVALGAPYTVNEIDFVGAGVNAVRVGNKITVNVAGGGGGSITLTEIEVNMGDKSPSKKFTVPDASITPSSKILVFPSPNQATGRRGNDWELDQATLTALAGTGNFQLSVLSPFRMRGNRKMYYQVV